MTVLDACAVLAVLRDEAGADDADAVIRGRSGRLTAVGQGELIDHLVRLAGIDEASAALDLRQLGLGTPLPVDGELGSAAGRLRARSYHRGRCAVRVADCIAAEAARAAGERLATSDPHLLDLCHAEGIAVLPLPDSTGRRWSPPRAPGRGGGRRPAGGR